MGDRHLSVPKRSVFIMYVDVKGRRCVHSVAGTRYSVTEPLLSGQFGPGSGNIEMDKENDSPPFRKLPFCLQS